MFYMLFKLNTTSQICIQVVLYLTKRRGDLFSYKFSHLVFLFSGPTLHGGSLRRTKEVPGAVGWWTASVVATVTADHARRSQGSQQTAAKSLCSAVPADSGWGKLRQWYRLQEQVCQNVFIHKK